MINIIKQIKEKLYTSNNNLNTAVIRRVYIWQK